MFWVLSDAALAASLRFARLDEFREVRLTCLKCDIRQISPEQFIPQPNAIGVDHIAFAVIRNLSNVTIAKIFLHLCAANAVWLTRQSHHATDLMQGAFAGELNEERTVTEVNCVVGVTIEI